MTIKELLELIGGKLANKADVSREIECGYACDLLSWVMAKGQSGTAWITVQTHMNVVAVAALLDMAAIIHPESIEAEAQSAAKAEEEGIALIVSPLTAYDICAKMAARGVKSV